MLQLRCLVEECLGGASNRTNLWVQFSHCHAQYIIVILEEGNIPYPRWLKYDMFVSHKVINVWHLLAVFFRS